MEYRIDTERHTWLEDCRYTKGRTNPLSKKDLIVFGTQTGHHDTKDMQKTATDE
jgi:hypothetical protein